MIDNNQNFSNPVYTPSFPSTQNFSYLPNPNDLIIDQYLGAVTEFFRAINYAGGSELINRKINYKQLDSLKQVSQTDQTEQLLLNDMQMVQKYCDQLKAKLTQVANEIENTRSTTINHSEDESHLQENILIKLNEIKALEKELQILEPHLEKVQQAYQQFKQVELSNVTNRLSLLNSLAQGLQQFDLRSWLMNRIQPVIHQLLTNKQAISNTPIYPGQQEIQQLNIQLIDQQIHYLQSLNHATDMQFADACLEFLLKDCQNLTSFIQQQFFATGQPSSPELLKQFEHLIQSINFLNNVLIPLKTLDQQQNKVQSILQKCSSIFKGQSFQPLIPHIHSSNSSSELSTSQGNPSAFPTIPYAIPLSQKLLFHIHASSYGANSTLQGMNSSEPLMYIAQYAKARQQVGHPIEGFDHQLVNSLEEAASLFDLQQKALQDNQADLFAVNLQQKIYEAFQSGKPLLLRGGWSGSPGHAIYYEVIPTSANHCTFRLYNLGEGLNHHAKRPFGNKDKHVPFVDWENIKASHLLNLQFGSILFDLSKKTHEGSLLNFKPEDVYHSLYEILQPSHINYHENDPNAVWMTKQHIGNCSWKSLTPLLYTRLGKDNYKRFMLELMTTSHLDYFNDHTSQNGAPSLEDWTLITKNTRNLERLMLDLLEEGLITPAYYNQAHQQLNKINHWIEQSHQALFSTPGISLPSAGIFSLDYPTASFQAPVNLHEQIQHTQSVDPVQPMVYAHESIQSLQWSPQNVQANLERVKELFQNCWNQEKDLELNTTFVELIKSLPTEPEFWIQATNQNPKQAEQLIELICDISHLFFKSCYMIPSAHRLHSSKIYAFIKALHIQTFLSGCVNPRFEGITFELGKGYNSLERINPSDREIPTRFIDGQEFRDLVDHENSKTLAGKLIHQNRNDRGLNPEFTDFNSSWTARMDIRPELKYCQFCLNYKEYYKELEAAYLILNETITHLIQTGQLKQEELPLSEPQQIAYLHARQLFPPWFQKLNDSHLYLLNLLYTPIMTPSYLDRQSDSLTFARTLQMSRDESFKDMAVIRYHLKGMPTPYDVTQQSKVLSDALAFDELSSRVPIQFSHDQPKFESKSFEKLVGLIKKIHMMGYSEKNLITDPRKVMDLKKLGIDLPEEEVLEILNIFTNPDLQAEELIGFFSRHPDKLTCHDYQALFRLALFEPSALASNVKNQQIQEQLEKFFRLSVNLHANQGQIQTTTFLLQISRYLQSFFPDRVFPTDTQTIHQLLQKDNLTTEEKSFLYREHLALCSKRSSLTSQDIAAIIIGQSFLNRHPVPDAYRDLDSQREVETCLVRHAATIRDYLYDKEHQRIRHDKLNLILATLNPEFGFSHVQWSTDQQDNQAIFTATLGNQILVFSPLEGRLLINGLELIYLPVEIHEHPSFKALFPHTDKATVTKEGIFKFDDQGNPTLVKIIGGELIIEQKRDNQWLQWIPASKLETRDKKDAPLILVGSRYLTEHYQAWQNPETRHLYFIHPSTKEIEFEALIDAQNHKVTKVSPFNQDRQLNLNPYTFSYFEKKDYIHEWFNANNQLKEVQFPRLHLSFTSKNSQLESDQYRGYALQPQAKIPYLGSFNRYLVLQQGGKKKILIPHLEFNPVLGSKNALKPDYDAELATSSKHTYYEYEVDEKGKLVSTNQDANLYLATILTMHHEYAAASKLLHKIGPSHQAYSPSQLKLLEQLINIPTITGDEDPECIALCTYASYLDLKNAILHKRPIDTNKLNRLAKTYTQHIQRNRNAKIFKLSKNEELFILKVLSQHEKLTPSLFFRFKELDPQGSEKATRPFDASNVTFFNTSPSVSEPELPNLDSYQAFLAPKQPILFVRPYQHLFKHFAYYYNGAREVHVPDSLFFHERNPFFKQQLEAAIIFMKNSTETQHKILAAVFDEVIKNPSHYPPIKYDHGEGIPDYNEKSLKDLFRKAQTYQFASNQLSQPVSNLSDKGRIVKRNQIKPAFNFSVSLNHPIPHYALNEIPDQLFKTKTSSKPSHSVAFTHLDYLLTLANPLHSQEIKTEVTRLKDEFNAYNQKLNETVKPLYLLDSANSLSVLNENLVVKHKHHQEEIQDLEQTIIQLANTPPLSEHEHTKWQGKIKAKEQDVLDIEELCLYFGQQNWKAIFKRNPNLTEAQLSQLVHHIGHYLSLKTHLNQIEKSQALCHELQESLAKEGTSLESIKDLSQRLGEELHRKRAYDPREYPSFLVFENFAGFILKEEQVQLLKDFLKTGNINPLAEMIMGSGKSKVLVPLLALLRAKPGVLSMVVVPAALYETVSSDVHQVLHGAFGKLMYGFNFDRETSDPQTIDYMGREIKAVLNKKGCLITTSQSIQSLLLHFIEQVFTAVSSEEKIAQLDALRQMIVPLAENGFPILDEVDLLLNVLYLVCFSSGKKEPVSKENYELIGEIYSVLYTHVNAHYDVDSDPFADKTKPPLTEVDYQATIKPALAHSMIERFKKGGSFSNIELDKKCQQFFNKLSSTNQELVMAYLCHDTKSQAFYDNIPDKEIQNLLALAAEEISNLIPKTLLKKCDEKYGICEGQGTLAIPFSGPNAPNIGSQFSNIFVTTNYTIQTVMKKGVPPQVLSEIIKDLQAKALLEVKNLPPGQRDITQTEAWKTFTILKGELDIPLFKLSSSQQERLLQHINSSIKNRKDCLIHGILPHLEVYKKIISSNPQNLVTFFKFIQGFTGTLWNKGSLHPSLNPPKEAQGTDAKTIHLLQQKAQGNIVEINSMTTDEMLNELINHPQLSFSLISDVGGYFKDADNRTIARKQALAQQKPVAFFNPEGKILVTDGKQEQTYSRSIDCYAFIDQSHTTGADIKQSKEAKGVLTIGAETTLRDLLQGAWRLRELDKQQNIQFILNHETASLIRAFTKKDKQDKLTLDDILLFVINNQAVQQGQDNFRALSQQIWNVPQMLLLKALLNPTFDLHQIDSLKTDLEQLWFKNGWTDPKDAYGRLPTLEPTKHIIQQQIQECLKVLSTLYEKHPFLETVAPHQELKKDVQQFEERVTLLPEKVLVGGTNQNNNETMKLNQQTQQQTKVTTQVEAQEQKSKQRTELGFTKYKYAKHVQFIKPEQLSQQFPEFKTNQITAIPLEALVQKTNEFKEFKIGSFFEGLYAAENALNWENGQESDIKHLKLLGSNRTSFNFISFYDQHIILLDHTAARHKQLLKQVVSLDLIDWSTLNSEQKTQVVKCKFLRGDSFFSNEELKYLKPVLQANPSEMQRFYLEQIIAGYPMKVQAYEESTLQRLFQSLL